METKKIVFLTGTRADFGKLKPLINKVEQSNLFDCHIFVTGMHMLAKYGSTFIEVVDQKYQNIHPFINQTTNTDMDIILSNTILGFSNYVKEIKPDLIIVHGDRVEALAGAMVGALNNILVVHIEGGEVSGTIDELIRHAITKMSHIHFVANKKAKQRLIQMGEKKDTIFIIGSPDIDIMMSDSLPLLSKVKKHYEISFNTYSIFCYHPVTTELDQLETNINNTISALIESNKNYVVIYPNNDPGSDIILNAILTLEEHKNFRILPSMRFEYFLTLLKNCEFIIGNSSSGIRGAGLYGVPAINIGTRQKNRSENKSIINVPPEKDEIQKGIKNIEGKFFEKTFEFGQGNSTELFYKTLKKKDIWKLPHQKQFVDQQMSFKEDIDSILEIDIEK